MGYAIKRPIIIGGGIGGLCVAIALRQAGIETIIYEQAERISSVGAGLTLWANAIKAFRRLGLADAIIRAGSKIERAEIRTSTGRPLSRSETGEFEHLFGEPTIAIHRADLHEILLSAIPAKTVFLNKKCLGFEPTESSVNVHFDGGFSDKTDLLIGADGINSIVRRRLFPEASLRYSGYTAWRGVVATEDESALGLTTESWGCGSRFGILRIDKQRVYWFATANAPAAIVQDSTERKASLLQRFKGWHHPIGLLLESTPADEILHNDIYDLQPMKRWGEGRVILLGDAVHPTTPNMGQGACMAVESALVLARCMSQEDNLADSLRRYEAERMARTTWITKQSRRIGRVGQLESPIACLARDTVLRMTPPRLMRKTLERAAGYEL